MVGPNDSSWLTILMEWLRNTFGNAPSNNPPQSNFNQPPPIQPPGSQNSSPVPPPSFPSIPPINPSSGPAPPPSADFVSTPTDTTNNPLLNPSFNKLPTNGESPLTGNVSNLADQVWDKLVPDSAKKQLKDHLGNVSLGTMVGFIFKLFLSLYFYMTVAGIIVVYKLFQALKTLGFLDAFKNLLYKNMGSVFKIADQCFLKLGDLKQFWDCIKPL